jgi:hypothetical protein
MPPGHACPMPQHPAALSEGCLYRALPSVPRRSRLQQSCPRILAHHVLLQWAAAPQAEPTTTHAMPALCLFSTGLSQAGHAGWRNDPKEDGQLTTLL